MFFYYDVLLKSQLEEQKIPICTFLIKKAAYNLFSIISGYLFLKYADYAQCPCRTFYLPITESLRCILLPSAGLSVLEDFTWKMVQPVHVIIFCFLLPYLSQNFIT